jgi:hypothetical protein
MDRFGWFRALLASCVTFGAIGLIPAVVLPHTGWAVLTGAAEFAGLGWSVQLHIRKARYE